MPGTEYTAVTKIDEVPVLLEMTLQELEPRFPYLHHLLLLNPGLQTQMPEGATQAKMNHVREQLAVLHTCAHSTFTSLSTGRCGQVTEPH